ncbi:helix-turn-helix domain-containing protein [Bifidobacterium thermophilum]|uniref:Helix-turn-helix domain-containing protein n=1 Tax=Bifidobacterium thermophilum TaxID=33905 RepID=A0A7X9NQJ5_9BIFI|nr:helix-turn-helix domain-containing protein [Bifidobacterium thermophilum]NME61941.1 helix-turn-helix domain-containing protein [Bifidobacterium thermophilum]
MGMHRGLDAAVRREIVLRHRAGTTPTALAQAFHIDPSSVHNTLARYRRDPSSIEFDPVTHTDPDLLDAMMADTGFIGRCRRFTLPIVGE